MHVNQYSSDRHKINHKENITNEIINRCNELSYTFIGEYINYSTRIHLKCNLHNFDWHVFPGNFLNKDSKCPVCSERYLDNNIIDIKLKNRNIQRIGDFTHSSVKLKWKCLKDSHIWEATTSSILNANNGCPMCSNNIRLTNEIIDEKIKDRSFIRVSNFTGSNKDKIEWKCKIDGHIWGSSPNNIFNGNGCPKCVNHIRVTDEIIDSRIKDRNIIRMESINDKIVDEKIKWKCNICTHTWLAKITSVISRGCGCPECKWSKTEKELHNLIKNLNIKCVRQKRVDYENKRMFVDFMLNDIVFLEYNGQQHYKPVRFGGRSIKESKKMFQKQIKRDSLLRKYCLENNIKLIEIPYYEKKENWESIILKTIKG